MKFFSWYMAGIAWLPSVRVVRCSVYSVKRTKPLSVVFASLLKFATEIIFDEMGMTLNRYDPYLLGCSRHTLVSTIRLYSFARIESKFKTSLSSD
jgi:hypothetical protein